MILCDTITRVMNRTGRELRERWFERAKKERKGKEKRKNREREISLINELGWKLMTGREV